MPGFLVIRGEAIAGIATKHSYEEAVEEAKDLARRYPHTTWHVYEKKGKAQAVKSIYEEVPRD